MEGLAKEEMSAENRGTDLKTGGSLVEGNLCSKEGHLARIDTVKLEKEADRGTGICLRWRSKVVVTCHNPWVVVEMRAKTVGAASWLLKIGSGEDKTLRMTEIRRMGGRETKATGKHGRMNLGKDQVQWEDRAKRENAWKSVGEEG